MFWYWLSNFNTNRHRNKIHSGWLNSGFCIVVVACLNMGLEWDGNFIFCLSCSNLANSLRSWMVVNAFHNSIVTKPTATIIAITPNATPIKSGPFGHTRSTISPSAFVKRWSITNSGPRSNAENQLKKIRKKLNIYLILFCHSLYNENFIVIHDIPVRKCVFTIQIFICAGLPACIIRIRMFLELTRTAVIGMTVFKPFLHLV